MLYKTKDNLKFKKNNIFLLYSNKEAIGPINKCEYAGYFRKYRDLILRKQIHVNMGLFLNT